MRKINKILIRGLIISCLVIFLLTCYINLIVIATSSKDINVNINYKDYEYVLVLGAKVSNGTPSLMLKDRLDKVIEIYNQIIILK